MDQIRGKTAVVTGGGSGIGRALVLAFAGEGMNVAVADIEAGPAEAVASEARARGVKALAITCDVSSRASVGALADAAFAAFGHVDLLCNNAGVVTFHPAQQMKDSDWDWVIAVDLLGVVHGVEAFLPRMLKQGTGGHIVNTASIAGMVAGAAPGISSYTTAKYGVVGLSESLRPELAANNIGVSVLCPGGVRTQIVRAERNRPAEYGGPSEPPAALAGGIQAGMEPADVAALVLRAVKENQLYVMTHQDTRAAVEARFKAIMDAYDWAARD
jgi:NAD(P)-dependent dehydrogenase (short-subunit alcohol dehydrogenase family)